MGRALAWVLRALADAVDRSDLAFVAVLFLVVGGVLVVVYAATFGLMWLL
jgi:hypothetical protein